ncbi:hypothetical protein GN244_ATG06021 [Phytophthora infestans]|uniref:Uncharacterized protein n=1 Tax=Phytophthora infestans TaxID=4787 RepID=A0A833W470_PHYIN|nr:hypothetical protein GN244_ATG06021 [Phytophthora infestans]KAF4135303.1 hypothetical protein GN958_ATG15491 [Phytophthora infestans]
MPYKFVVACHLQRRSRTNGPYHKLGAASTKTSSPSRFLERIPIVPGGCSRVVSPQPTSIVWAPLSWMRMDPIPWKYLRVLQEDLRLRSPLESGVSGGPLRLPLVNTGDELFDVWGALIPAPSWLAPFDWIQAHVSCVRPKWLRYISASTVMGGASYKRL